jgi:hypothetical protein
MADKTLSQVIGDAGGSFVPYSTITAISTPTGSSGDIYDITPAAGNVLRVLSLSTGSTTTEPGMTVTITNNNGSQDLITNDVLDEFQPTGEFYIGDYAAGTLNQSRKSLPFVDCQRIVVTKVAGNTVTSTDIAYIEGRVE